MQSNIFEEPIEDSGEDADTCADEESDKDIQIMIKQQIEEGLQTDGKTKTLFRKKLLRKKVQDPEKCLGVQMKRMKFFGGSPSVECSELIDSPKGKEEIPDHLKIKTNQMKREEKQNSIDKKEEVIKIESSDEANNITSRSVNSIKSIAKYSLCSFESRSVSSNSKSNESVISVISIPSETNDEIQITQNKSTLVGTMNHTETIEISDDETVEKSKEEKEKEEKKKQCIEVENLKVNKEPVFRESDEEMDNLSISSLSDLEFVSKGNIIVPKSFNFLTWNTNGLCDILVKTRMLKIIEIIKKSKVSVVFLQEVVPETVDLLHIYLSDTFEIIEADDSCGKKLSYFCVTLVSKNIFTIIHKETFWFYGTVMGRHAIKTLVHLKEDPNNKMLIINTHLESTLNFKKERLCQLKQCIVDMIEHQEKQISTIIFGGDLNIRDQEIKSIYFPSNILDIWEYLGSPKDCKYTWNCCMGNKFFNTNFFSKSKFRYDRVYWMNNNEETCIQPIYMKKVGEKRLSKEHNILPSDHYGLFIKFNII